MYATYTTLVGRVITAPEKQTYDRGTTRVHFRVACTERRRNGNGWDDGETLYITVRVWRQLAENVQKSMSVGDPVVVHGKVYTRSVEREGSRLSLTEMEAFAVGPDLRWSTAVVTRTKAAAAGAPTGLPETPAESSEEPGTAALESAPDDPWAPLDAMTAGEPGSERAAAGANGDGSGRGATKRGPVDAVVGS